MPCGGFNFFYRFLYIIYIKRIYQHLTEEMGFWEVGFAPVTTSPSTLSIAQPTQNFE